MKRCLAILLFLAAASCSAAPDYVAADRATFDAVAPEYARYVANDTTLTAEQITRRMDTIQSWEARLKAAEGSK